MSDSRIRFKLLFSALLFSVASAPLYAAEKEEPFLKVLEGAYEVSCGNVDRLVDYYLEDAEIIHDGRQTTLRETITELKRSLGTMKDLQCVYQPKVRGIRIGGEIAYLVVRETLRMSSESMGEQAFQQVCTYVFLKVGSKWMIGHDHCSTIPGEIT